MNEGVRVGGDVLREVPARAAVGGTGLARGHVARHARRAHQQVRLPALALALQRHLREVAAIHTGIYSLLFFRPNLNPLLM
jgi:hypothetical protein